MHFSLYASLTLLSQKIWDSLASPLWFDAANLIIKICLCCITATCIWTTVIMHKCAARQVCQSEAEKEKRGTGEEKGNLPRGGYSKAGDDMAKAAGTLEEHGQLPRVVWRTSADTALHCSSHISFLWLRLTGLCTKTRSLCFKHVNGAHRSRSDAVRHDWQYFYKTNLCTLEDYIKLVKHHANRNKTHTRIDRMKQTTKNTQRAPKLVIVSGLSCTASIPKTLKLSLSLIYLTTISNLVILCTHYWENTSIHKKLLKQSAHMHISLCSRNLSNRTQHMMNGLREVWSERLHLAGDFGWSVLYKWLCVFASILIHLYLPLCVYVYLCVCMRVYERQVCNFSLDSFL